MSGAMDLELLISVSAGLGRWVEDRRGRSVYAKDKDCLACLKDLQRFLRRDSPETRDAFMLLGRYNLAKTDLVPLLITYPNDEELLYNALKVVTYLTMPIAPDSDAQMQQAEYMQQVKAAFLAKDAMSVVMGLVTGPLGRHPRMSEQDCVTVQLVLTFIRNLLCIPDPNRSNTAAGDHKSRMQAELLERLFKEHVMELLVGMAQHAGAADDTFQPELLLEIFHQVFQGVDPASLVSAPGANPTREGGSNAVMRELMEQEAAVRRARAPVGRAGRMGAVIAAKIQTKGASSGKPVAITGPALTGRRSKAGPAPAPPRALGVALTAQLRGLAETFLTEAYAILMTEMKRKVEAVVGYERDRSTDLQRYMRVVTFFTAFVRLRTEQATASTPNADPPAESPFATISATFCHPTVNFLFRNWTVQMSEALKSPDKDWELQGAAVVCLKEQLRALQLALLKGSEHDRTAADAIFCAVLHNDSEEAGLLPAAARQIKSFNHLMQRKEVAEATVEIMHVVTEQLEALAERKFVVARKRAVRRRKVVKGGIEDGEAAEAEAEGEEAEGEGGQGRDRAPMDELLGENDMGDEGDGDEDGEKSPAAVKEVELNRQELSRRLVTKLANPAVIHFYVWLLQGAARNSARLNAALLDMLQRVCDPQGFNCEAMLYQLSVLRVFHAILSDAPLWKDKRFYRLLDFCKQLVRRMFARMIPERAAGEQVAETSGEVGAGSEERAAWEAAWSAKRAEVKAAVELEAGSMMFVELMFWKDKSAARELQGCYDIEGLLDSEYRAGRASVWNEVVAEPSGKADTAVFDADQLEELRTLWALHRVERDSYQRVADEFGGGVTRRQVARALQQAGVCVQDFDEQLTMKLQLAWEAHTEDGGEGGTAALVAVTEELAVLPITRVAAKLRELGITGIRVRAAPRAPLELSEEERMRAVELYNGAGGGREGIVAVRAEVSALKSNKAVRSLLKEAGDAAHGLTPTQVEAVKAAYDESGAAQYKKSAGKAVAAVRGALSDEVDANAGSVRKALSILGLISAPPAWTEEQTLSLQAMHETLTRASDFWNVAIDEFGSVFSRRRIASRLKTLGLPIPRATGDDDSDSDASEEKPSTDTDAPASAQRLGKALHQLHKLRGAEKMALGVEWLERCMRFVLAHWAENSYSDQHTLEAGSEEERTLIEEPRFVKVLRLLRLVKDKESERWCFPGVNGAMWINSLQDALRAGVLEAKELRAKEEAEEEELRGASSEDEDNHEGGDGEGSESDDDEDEEDAVRGKLSVRKPNSKSKSAALVDTEEGGARKVADWSDEDSDGGKEDSDGDEVGGARPAQISAESLKKKKRLRRKAESLPIEEDDNVEEPNEPVASSDVFKENDDEEDVDNPSSGEKAPRRLKRLGRLKKSTVAIAMDESSDDDKQDDGGSLDQAADDSPAVGGARPRARALLDDDSDEDAPAVETAAEMSEEVVVGTEVLESEEVAVGGEKEDVPLAMGVRRGRMSRLQAMAGRDESDSDESEDVDEDDEEKRTGDSSVERSAKRKSATPDRGDGSKEQSASPVSPLVGISAPQSRKKSRLQKRSSAAGSDDDDMNELQLSPIVAMDNDLDDI